jgi:hypothetical protein
MVPVGRGRNLQLGDARGYQGVNHTTAQLDIMYMYDVYVGVSTLLKTNGEQQHCVGGANRTNERKAGR